MSKMSELSQVLDELVTCGEGLIRAANSIREMLMTAPEEQSKVPAMPEKTDAPAAAPEEKKYSTPSLTAEKFNLTQSKKSTANIHSSTVVLMLLSTGSSRQKEK